MKLCHPPSSRFETKPIKDVGEPPTGRLKKAIPAGFCYVGQNSHSSLRGSHAYAPGKQALFISKLLCFLPLSRLCV